MGSNQVRVAETSPPDVQELRRQLTAWLTGGTYAPGRSSQEFQDWLKRNPPRSGIQSPADAKRYLEESYGQFSAQYQGAGGGQGFDKLAGFLSAKPAERPGEVALDSRAWIDRSMLPQARTSFGAPEIDPINRGMIRDVGGIPDVAASTISARDTQSIDQLGGANSAFFRNVMEQLSPAFDQRRAEGIAAARHAAGNLVGSGRANLIGGAVNRSLGEERAALTDYATRGLQLETARQQEGAGRALQADISNQGQALQAALANQGVSLQSALANQGADTSFLQAFLERGKANQGAALQAAELGQRGEIANIGSIMQALTSNQGVAQFLAQLQQQREMGIYGTESEANQRQAQNYLNLILGLLGIQGQPYQTGDWKAIVGPLIQGAATYAGRRG